MMRLPEAARIGAYHRDRQAPHQPLRGAL